MDRSALIAGVTGIVGNNLARHPLRQGWEVCGLARRRPIEVVTDMSKSRRLGFLD